LQWVTTILKESAQSPLRRPQSATRHPPAVARIVLRRSLRSARRWDLLPHRPISPENTTVSLTAVIFLALSPLGTMLWAARDGVGWCLVKTE
jgi:hypothetical protein